MKPSVKLSLGLFIVVIGALILAFANKLASAVGSAHVVALSLAAMLLGFFLICVGVWCSGVRIKFPPKNGGPRSS